MLGKRSRKEKDEDESEDDDSEEESDLSDSGDEEPEDIVVNKPIDRLKKLTKNQRNQKKLRK